MVTCVPGWIKSSVDAWTSSASLQSGVLFRPVCKTGKVRSTGFTAKVIWSIVRQAVADCGFGTVVPHDLGRTCARLCDQAEGELEQIHVPTGSHLRPYHRLLSGLQAKAPEFGAGVTPRCATCRS